MSAEIITPSLTGSRLTAEPYQLWRLVVIKRPFAQPYAQTWLF